MPRSPLLAPLLATGTLLLAPGAAPPLQGETPPADAARIPEVFEIGRPVDLDLVLEDLAGAERPLRPQEGHVWVVDFWSTQCPWTEAYEARLDALLERFGARDVRFLVVDANEPEIAEGPPHARIVQHLERAELARDVLVDPGQVVATRFGARTTPHVFVVDARGILRYSGAIDDDPRGRRPAAEVHAWLADALEAVLAGREVAVPHTRPFGCSLKHAKAVEPGGGR